MFVKQLCEAAGAAAVVRCRRVRMKDFRLREARRLGVSEGAISMRLAAGKYRGQISIEHTNARVVWVTPMVGFTDNVPLGRPAAGIGFKWVQMKSWVQMEALRLGLADSTVRMRLWRGKYQGKITIFRENARVVWVSAEREQPMIGIK